MEDALEGIGRMWEAGVRTIVTTPHLDGFLTRAPGQLEARLEEVDAAWLALREAAGEAYPDLDLRRGHEVMLDVPDPDLTDPRVRLAETASVLVEWPRLHVPPATAPALARLRDMGTRVILAHPERYRGLDPELNLAGEWREMGALLQVNYGSLAGRYGDAPRRRALTLLSKGWVDLFSTDFHARPQLSLYIRQARRVLEMMAGEDVFATLAGENPARVLAGEELVPVRPLLGKRGLKEKVLDLLRGKE